MKRVLLLIVVLNTLCITVYSQKVTSDKSERISQYLQNLLPSTKIRPNRFILDVQNVDKLIMLLDSSGVNYLINSRHANIVDVSFEKKVLDSLINIPDLIRFADVVRKPNEETTIAGHDNSVNRINLVHFLHPELDGDERVASVKESAFDTSDIDLRHRTLFNHLASKQLSSHATIMATLVAGAGNTFYTSKGVAGNARLSSSDFQNLLPDPAGYYDSLKITVQNHSYGTGIENYYGADAAAYDRQIWNNPLLIHVFSAGNLGREKPASGRYAGLLSFATISGSFKQAKNVLTVASADSLYRIDNRSSRGPAFDGRLKPELAAYGIEGSSGSAALVSGIVLLAQQQFKLINNKEANSDLIKAILLNTADDIGNKGIDYSSGYGNANAAEAILAIREGKFFRDSVEHEGIRSFSITVPENVRELKVLVYWNDAPAASNSSKALVNDLDLTVKKNSNGQSWMPWTLSFVADSLDLEKLPERKKDTLNNSEQVTIDLPVAGEYTIQVSGHTVKTIHQSFSISYRWLLYDSLNWDYPTPEDRLIAGKPVIFRFRSTFKNERASLEWNKGAEWIMITDSLDLVSGHYRWNAPDTFGTARFRIKLEDKAFETGLISISPVIEPSVGFNCADSVMVYWNQVSGAGEYIVYRLNGSHMEPVSTTADTSYILAVRGDQSPVIAVSPVHTDKTNAIRSHALNYTTQGIECYLSNFLADPLNDNEVRLHLYLGSVYNIDSIIFEKVATVGFQPLFSSKADLLFYEWLDKMVTPGKNTYRVKLILMNGAVIYSRIVDVFSFSRSDILLFPVPVQQGSGLSVAIENSDHLEMMISDASGRIILKKRLISQVETIQTNNLAKGIYFYVFKRKGSIVKRGKLSVI